MPARAASGAILDLLVAVALLVLGVLASTWVFGNGSDAVIRTVVILLVVAVTVGVPAVVETLTRGRTLGKLALGLRVVRDDGGPITARHALTRALVGWVEIYLLFGAGALVAGLVSPRAKRLGDMAAGTYVVSQRASMRMLPPPVMPPPLAAWAHGADLAALPPGTGDRHPPVPRPRARAHPGRAAVSSATASTGRCSPTSRPPPPPGIHPEYVLAAVIADRRRRDEERIARDDARRDAPAAARPARAVSMLRPSASTAAYPGLTTSSMIARRSSNGTNADFIALMVTQRRSSIVHPASCDEQAHLARHARAAHEPVVGVDGDPEAQPLEQAIGCSATDSRGAGLDVAARAHLERDAGVAHVCREAAQVDVVPCRRRGPPRRRPRSRGRPP